MKKEHLSRTESAIKNFRITIFTQVVNICLNFAVRGIFIKTLGIEYLGVEGLFSNVLSLLSMTEMGVGTAIAYSLYLPIAEGNSNKVSAILKFFSQIYIRISIIIFCIGILLSFSLEKWVEYPSNININLKIVFFLFLINTSISYIYAYKKSYIVALQKNYVIVIVHQILRSIQLVFQFGILTIWGNYYLYLILQILFTFTENIVFHFVTNFYYPINMTGNNSLSLYEIEKIKKNIKSLFKYKISSSILNGTDNIIISKFVDINSVGILVNYTTITGVINGVISQIFDSITSSIGNLNATENKTKQFESFFMIFFINAWIYAYLFVILYFLMDDFISIWIGKEFRFNNITFLCIILNFYVNGIHTTLYIYRSTLGLFTKTSNIAIFAALLNILFSILVAPYLGVAGILLVTAIVRIAFINLVDAHQVFNKYFGINKLKYYISNLIPIILIIISIFTGRMLINNFESNNIFELIYKGIVISLVFHIYISLYLFWDKKKRKFMLKLIKKILQKE